MVVAISTACFCKILSQRVGFGYATRALCTSELVTVSPNDCINICKNDLCKLVGLLLRSTPNITE